ncbi:MAG: hypothetical protein V3V36_01405, partial [Candidatus Hydrothermarchaeaceae archaeon]
LFVSLHNLTYTLGESDFVVEEVIVFENTGTPSGNLFKDNVYLIRGNARDVEVDVIGKNTGYSVEYSPLTTININLLFWRGEKREIILKYRRSDMLFRGDTIHVISGLALGTYPWIIDRASITFIAPEGFQFGNVTPDVTKTFEGSREVLTYDIAPVNIKDLTAIREGFPIRIEYAKYDEMAVSGMKAAREFIGEAESDLENANKSIENAMSYGSDTTSVLTLFATANHMLDDSKKAFELAEIKSNPYSAEYHPYGAYYYAKTSKDLAGDASRKAEESKDLANYEIQRTLEERISGIGSKLSEQPEYVEAAEPRPLINYWAAIILILAALVIFGAYKYTGSYREFPAIKRSTVKDFKAIDELKYKTFTGFDKKVDTVKHGTELATEIRSLMRKKEKLDFGIENLRKKKATGEIPDHTFESEKEKLHRQIDETVANIEKLQIKLKEIKKVKR